MTSPNPEIRIHEIKMRHLEIQATLAEWKRAYFVDGTERPYADRLTLEAEAAQLALERRVIEDAAFKAKLVLREQERKTLVYQLIAVLKERGMEEVIAEAESRAGLGDAPDLLGALMSLVEQVERGDFDHIGADHPDSAVIAAREAIAKATGAHA